MIDYEEATRNVVGYEPQENTHNQRSVSFSFSLQILTREGLSLKGDMTMQKTVVPQRASKPVTVDIEQEYDDNSVTSMPRSAIRFRGTQPTQRTTGPIAQAPTSNRVSGTTRLLLWVVLVLCCVFLANGLLLPAMTNAANQLRYGDARIVSCDLNGRHFITEENNGRVRVLVSSPDGTHNQVLTTLIGGVPNHALVTLSDEGNKIDMQVNGVHMAYIVSDNKGGYQWSNA